MLPWFLSAEGCLFAAVKEHYLDLAKAGGAALWLFLPTEAASNRLVRLLADYDYSYLRYYGKEGVQDIRL